MLLEMILITTLATEPKKECDPDMGLYFVSDTERGTIQGRYITCEGKLIQSVTLSLRSVIREYERLNGQLDWRL